MNALRLLLEYASINCFIDTIGFGLKNNTLKKPFELAIDLNRSEAIYLLNHYELNDEVLNASKYPTRLEHHIDVYQAKLESFLKIEQDANEKEDNANQIGNQIRNLIFEGGGVEVIAYLGLFKKSIESKIFQFTKIKIC